MFRKARFSKRVGFKKFPDFNSKISKISDLNASALLVPKNQPMNFYLLLCVNFYILFQSCDILCGFCLHSLEQGLGQTRFIDKLDLTLEKLLFNHTTRESNAAEREHRQRRSSAIHISFVRMLFNLHMSRLCVCQQ